MVRILLVDDDPRERILVQHTLENARRGVRYEIEWAPDIERALELLRNAPRFDAWLVDYRLAGEDGLDFLDRARVLQPTTPAIMLTGDVDPAVDERAMAGGATDFLVKGEVTPNLLDRCIRYAVRRAQVVGELRRSEERYALAVQGAQSAVWEWDTEADQMYVSGEWWALLGESRAGRFVQPEEVLARVHGPDVEPTRQRFEALRERGSGRFSVDLRVVDVDGVPVAQTWRGVVVDQPGRARRLVGVASVSDGQRDTTTSLSGALAEGVLEQVRARRRLEQLERMHEAIRAAQERFVRELGARDPRTFFDQLLRQSMELTGSAAGFIGVGRPAGDDDIDLQLFAMGDGGRLEVPGKVPLSDLERRLGHSFRRGDSARMNSVGHDVLPWLGARIESFLGLPILLAGRLVGLVGVANKPGGYQSDEAEFLAPFLDSCGALIVQLDNYARRMRVERELRRRDLMLRATNTATTALLREPGTQSGFDQMLAALGHAGGAQLGTLTRVTVEQGTRTVHRAVATWCVSGEPPPGAERLRQPLDYAAMGLGHFDVCYRGGKALRVLRSQADAAEKRLLDMLSVDAALAAPVFSGGEWWGVISLFGAAEAESWQAADVELLQGAANAVGAALVVAEKTTELAAANAALTRRDAHFRALLHGSSDLIAVLDGDLCFTYASPAAEDLFERTPAELLGSPLLERLHPNDVEALGWKLAQLNAERPVLEFECEARAGREWRKLAATVHDRRDDPHVGGYILNARDVTQQARLWAQLLQAQKMESVGRLAGGVAHDFNNTLSVILSYTELVTERLRPEDPLVYDIAEIERAAQRQAQLTRRILTFSRKQVFVPQVIEIEDVVLDLERMLERLLPEDVTLRRELGEDLPLVKVDVSQIEQAIVNLVLNARDAMPNGGRVDLTVEARELEAPLVDATGSEIGPGRYLVCRVRDSGVGIAPELVPQLFEPFFTTKPADRGTGLGLSTVYGIVRDCEGGVFVESEVGQGTQVALWLPETVDDVDDVRVTPSPPLEITGSERVVVLEDDAVLGSVLDRLLSGLGYDVALCGHPDAAIERCLDADAPPDLLLTDVLVPLKAGPDVAAEVHAERPGLPVLYMTGYRADEEVLDRIDRSQLLLKPFSRLALGRRIREVLDRRD